MCNSVCNVCDAAVAKHVCAVCRRPCCVRCTWVSPKRTVCTDCYDEDLDGGDLEDSLKTPHFSDEVSLGFSAVL